jgi:hypothetical protein
MDKKEFINLLAKKARRMGYSFELSRSYEADMIAIDGSDIRSMVVIFIDDADPSRLTIRRNGRVLYKGPNNLEEEDISLFIGLAGEPLF